MPEFKVFFINEKGQKIKKVIFASNKEELKKNLELTEDLLVLKIRKQFNLKDFFAFKKKISAHNFLIFNRELITLLKAGTPLRRALEVILENCHHSLLKKILLRALNDIKNGVAISEALASESFPLAQIYRATLLAGEKSGQLEKGLEKYCSYVGRVARLKSKTISSLAYPLLVIIFMLAIVTIIVAFVIPKFADFYSGFEASLPYSTTLLLNFSVFLKNNLLTILGALCLIFFILSRMQKKITDFSLLHQLQLKVPFVGPGLVQNYLSIFSRTMATLLSGGLTVPEAASLAVNTISNKYLFLQIKNIPVIIAQGKGLFQALQEVRFIPGLMLEMIQVGENSGNLATTLEETADHYEALFENRINTLISLIEPIIIILLGIVVSFMIVSIYLPIFSTIRVVD